jgi:adenosylhomocysteine nucleosidase
MHKPAVIIALKEEAVGIEYHNIYISGVGKVNATIATMKAINEGATDIINYGTAGAVNDLPGIVEPYNFRKGLVHCTGFVDRDMDATSMGFELGQTPYEKDVMIGYTGLICGTGDTFATKKPNIDCDIVDMEAYAIAKVCDLHDISFTCWKYISDNVDENSPTEFTELLHNLSKGNKEFNVKLKEQLKRYENN